MDIELKIQTIKDNKEIAIAALNSYLDTIYNMTDKFFDENGELKKDLTKDEKFEDFLKSTRQDASNFENVRSKLLNDDFLLSIKEINYIGLGFMFSFLRIKKETDNLIKTNIELKKIIDIVMEGVKTDEVNDNQIVDKE